MRWALYVVGLGVFVRLALIPFTAQADLETYAESSTSIAYGAAPYTYIIIYPPGWVFLTSLVGRLSTLFVPAYSLIILNPSVTLLSLRFGTIEPAALNAISFSILEKLPLMGIDAAIASLLYAIVRESGGTRSTARFAFALWFLNPFVLTASAVHGAFDALPSFLTLASVYLVFHRRMVGAGAALGLGIGTKVFPLFLIPFMAALLWTLHRKDGAVGIREIGLFLLGAAAAGLLIFWPPGILSTYVTFITTGPKVGVVFGGFGVWSFTGIPGLESPRSWLFNHYAIVAAVSVVASVGAAGLFAAWFAARRLGTPEFSAIARAMIPQFFAIYLVSPVIQPQYLLWVLPWIVLLLALDRRFPVSYLVITAGTLGLYYFALEGPLYLFQPLAVFTPFLSMNAVQASMLAWQPMVPWLRVLSEIPVFVALLFLTGYCLSRPAPKGATT